MLDLNCKITWKKMQDHLQGRRRGLLHICVQGPNVSKSLQAHGTESDSTEMWWQHGLLINGNTVSEKMLLLSWAANKTPLYWSGGRNLSGRCSVSKPGRRKQKRSAWLAQEVGESSCCNLGALTLYRAADPTRIPLVWQSVVLVSSDGLNVVWLASQSSKQESLKF